MIRSRPAMDLPKVGGAGFVVRWASRSPRLCSPILPEIKNPKISNTHVAVALLSSDITRFRSPKTIKWVGFGRGREEEEIGTSFKIWGGRRSEISPENTVGYSDLRRERERNPRGRREKLVFPKWKALTESFHK